MQRLSEEQRASMNRLTELVIGEAYRVHNYHGSGHKERIYENSLVIACRKLGLEPQQQVTYRMFFEGEHVGEYVADLVMNGLFLDEAKAVCKLTDEHQGQCMSYLRASGLPLCLLINFDPPRVELKRVVLDF